MTTATKGSAYDDLSLFEVTTYNEVLSSQPLLLKAILKWNDIQNRMLVYLTIPSHIRCHYADKRKSFSSDHKRKLYDNKT